MIMFLVYIYIYIYSIPERVYNFLYNNSCIFFLFLKVTFLAIGLALGWFSFILTIGIKYCTEKDNFNNISCLKLFYAKDSKQTPINKPETYKASDFEDSITVKKECGIDDSQTSVRQ